MGVVNRRLQELSLRAHNQMQDYANEYRETEEATRALRHLSDNKSDSSISSRNLPATPRSFGGGLSESTRSSWRSEHSTASERHRATETRNEREKKFEDLLRADERFHQLMSDLNGMRQWWDVNKKEYKKRRKQYNKIEGQKKFLENQLEDAINIHKKLLSTPGSNPANVENALRQCENFKSSVERYQASLGNKSDWFRDRENLMRRIRRHFKDIRYETEVSPITHSLRGSLEFFSRYKPARYEYDPSTPFNYKSTTWFKYDKNSILWWLKTVSTDLENVEELLTIKLELIIQDRDDYIQAYRNLQHRGQGLYDILYLFYDSFKVLPRSFSTKM
jgi:chromosome segregation ATPase